ncbi:MAG: nucleotide-binding protein [Pseudomonadota bacterium]
MARKSGVNTPSVKVALELNVSREEAKAKLQDRIEKGLALKRQISSLSEYEILSNEYDKWDSFNSELLKRLFTSEELEEEYSSWGVSISMSMYEKSIGEKIADRFKNIDNKIHRLDSIIERLELIPLNSTLAIATTNIATENPINKSKKVFVVHGHDERSKTNLEVFLHEIGLEPVVLHRQADEGLTIIEKFEKHGDVGYAFILLTPDEIAYLRTEEKKPDGERFKEFRARPNVIFEFGYFVGRLGRSRVCCLHTGNVKLPSDVSGVIYKNYQTSIEEVAYSIIKDLKAAGYTVA